MNRYQYYSLLNSTCAATPRRRRHSLRGPPHAAAGQQRVRPVHQGRAVQADSIKTRVECGCGFSLRLKLEYHKSLSNFALNFNLRCYIKDSATGGDAGNPGEGSTFGNTVSSTSPGRCTTCDCDATLAALCAATPGHTCVGAPGAGVCTCSPLDCAAIPGHTCDGAPGAEVCTCTMGCPHCVDCRNSGPLVDFCWKGQCICAMGCLDEVSCKECRPSAGYSCNQGVCACTATDCRCVACPRGYRCRGRDCVPRYG